MLLLPIPTKTHSDVFTFCQYSAKLLKKPDQCRAVYACSHLFWVDDQDGIKDGERYTARYFTSIYLTIPVAWFHLS